MALLAQRIINGLISPKFSRTRPPATESVPDRIVLAPRKGYAPSDKPPVRIYLGSERHQFRAERAFLWSIERHRDPSRTYEIFLMRDLSGFSRGFWLTGFTNYRFAIPAFCHYQGRAIYNDADQVYLTDPADLFDQPMGDAGFLSINDRDTSVMLIDCERMATTWNELEVRNKSRKQLEAVARSKGLWGDLDDGWNARDKEYDPTNSKLVHFTTLHTQPWRPFPSQMVYFENPTHELWPDIEADANENRFLPFNEFRPSRHWASVLLFLSSKQQAETWLDLLKVQEKPFTQSVEKKLEIRGLFEYVPDQDALWVLVRLLEGCKELVIYIKEPWLHHGGQFKRSLSFWLEHLELAQKMCPTARWALHHHKSPWSGSQIFYGGRALAGSVVALQHQKPGHNQQADALAKHLAERLGRAHKTTSITASEASFILNCVVLRRPPKDHLPEDCAILVAGGWLPNLVARAYQRHYPYLRIVLSGRKAGPVPSHGGVVVQCAHFGLPPHPKRITTLVPLNFGHVQSCQEHAPWEMWLNAPTKVACLLGGNTKAYHYDDHDLKALGQLLRQQADAEGSILVVGSRRSASLIEHLRTELPENTLFYHWRANDPTNPYSLALGEADKLVVTGESESMLADALATGRGFSIFYPPKNPTRMIDRFSHWVARRAIEPQYNRRGSIRPQQGIQYLCARAMERGWILPPRDLAGLHQTLYAQGFAAPAGDQPLGSFMVPPVAEGAIQQMIDELDLEFNPKPKLDAED